MFLIKNDTFVSLTDTLFMLNFTAYFVN